MWVLLVSGRTAGYHCLKLLLTVSILLLEGGCFPACMQVCVYCSYLQISHAHVHFCLYRLNVCYIPVIFCCPPQTHLKFIYVICAYLTETIQRNILISNETDVMCTGRLAKPLLQPQLSKKNRNLVPIFWACAVFNNSKATLTTWCPVAVPWGTTLNPFLFSYQPMKPDILKIFVILSKSRKKRSKPRWSSVCTLKILYNLFLCTIVSYSYQ